MAKPKPLSPKQRAFCREFVIDHNATKAAIRAGYTERSARSEASRLMTKVNIQEEIEILDAEVAKAAKVDAERWLKEIARIAFSDLSQAFTPEGKLLPIVEMPEDIRRAIIGMEVEELWEGPPGDKFEAGVTRKIKLGDKVRALEMVGKYLKVLTDRVDHSSSDGSMSPKSEIDLKKLSKEDLLKLREIAEKAK